MFIRVLSFGVLALLVTANVSAQTCLGLPSFSTGPFQASAGAAFTDGAQQFNGGLALGSENVFGGATLAFTNFSEIDSNATSFAASVGATFPVSQQERIEACPVASVIITSGPDIGELDVSAVGLRAGGRLGLVAAETGNMEIVPTFGLDIAYDRIRAELADVETTDRETYMIARAGVGFVLNRRIAFVPTLGIPLGLDDSDPEFSFIVAFQFGER